MDFPVDIMEDHFNKCAKNYDRHLYKDLGICKFYDEIEKQINNCGNPKNILVLGCGTGLEIERIKYSAIVTAIDISAEMLAELKKKELYPGMIINTICCSFFDVIFNENIFDLVICTYSFHYFTVQQKALLYNKIYSCLKINGCFINGDIVCKHKDVENKLIKKAEGFYQKKQLTFGSLYINTPLALDTELCLLSETGFNDISVKKRWNKVALIKAVK